MRLTRGGTDALPDDNRREWLIEQDPCQETNLMVDNPKGAVPDVELNAALEHMDKHSKSNL